MASFAIKGQTTCRNLIVLSKQTPQRIKMQEIDMNVSETLGPEATLNIYRLEAPEMTIDTTFLLATT